MNYTSTLILQVSSMFITIVIGVICKKVKAISDEFVKDLGNLLFLVINPLSIFNSFCTEYTSEKAIGLAIAFGVGVLMLILAIILAEVFFKADKYRIENFATVINNPGFFGLPIVSAVLGSSAIFYVVPYVVINTIVQYTYGSYVMSKDKREISFRKIITNTNVIATILGLIFFLLRIPLPTVFSKTFSTLGSLMGSLCALIIGANLANTNFKDLGKDLKTLPLVLFFRLIVISFATIVVLKFIPCDEIIKYTLVITLATPSGTSTTVFARNYNRDTAKAARFVSVCSLSTIVTMPLMFSLIPYFW